MLNLDEQGIGVQPGGSKGMENNNINNKNMAIFCIILRSLSYKKTSLFSIFRRDRSQILKIEVDSFGTVESEVRVHENLVIFIYLLIYLFIISSTSLCISSTSIKLPFVHLFC